MREKLRKMRGEGNSRVLLKSFILLTSICFTFCGCKKASLMQGAEQTAEGNQQLQTSSGNADFTIAVIPDTQTYTSESISYTPPPYISLYYNQTQWIAAHKTDSNIVYAVHLGDISENGDNITVSSHSLDTIQWKRANTAMGYLDAANVPYGMAVGNHDEGNQNQTDRGNSLSTTKFYNLYFGYNNPRFAGKSFYGGHYGSDNNNHYDLFSAGGLDFIVIYIMYDDQTATANVNARAARNAWAKGLLTGTYAGRKAIIVTHYVGSPATPSTFSTQAQEIYDTLSSCRNIFMFLGGHVHGEGYRQDTKGGRTIKSFISDYQFDYRGGDGYMRLMKFSRDRDLISVRTYSPFADSSKTGSSSAFTHAWFHEQTTTRTCDFNNNGMTDLYFFSSGNWTVNGISGTTSYGVAGDIPTPADYDGDGETDYSVFRPAAAGKFWIKGQPGVDYGQTGDIPVPADYDGDGRADCAVWRPGSSAKFWINNQPGIIYGQTGDIPVPGDYDGDGKADCAVYRPGSSGKYWINDQPGIIIGTTNDIPVPGDYNADGKIDPAVFRPSTGQWLINGQTTVGALVTPASGDIPVPGDYYGDGKTHPAVYRPSTHTLYKYSSGTVTTATITGTGKPYNLPYAIRQAFPALN